MDYRKMLDLFSKIGVKFEECEGYFSTDGIKTDPQDIIKFQGLSVLTYDGEDDVTHRFLMDGSHWCTSSSSAYSA